MDSPLFIATLSVFVIIGLGFAMRRAHWLTQEADESLLNIVIRLLVPCLILSVVMDNPALDDRANLIIPPVVGFGAVVLGFGVAWLFARTIGPKIGLVNGPQQRTFALCVGIFNYGYIAIPICKALFGNETLGVLFVHNVGVEICMWTVGIALVSGQFGIDGLKRIVNAPTIAIVVALVINFTNTAQYLPGFVTNVIEWLGGCAIPMALVMIGATIADHFRKRDIVRGKRIMVAAVALRIGVLPAAFLAIASILPGTTDLKRVVILEAAMPAGVFPIVLARHYGGDVRTAVRVVLATSLVSLLTMTTWITLGKHLILGQ